MNLLFFTWAISLGFIPLEMTKVGDVGNYMEDMTHVSIEASAVLFDRIELGGALHSKQRYIELTNWQQSTIQSDFRVRVHLFGYEQERFNIIFSLDRQCEHPVNSQLGQISNLNRGFAEISICVKGRTN